MVQVGVPVEQLNARDFRYALDNLFDNFRTASSDMCGRFTLATPAPDLQLAFNLDEVPPLYVPRYNIAPTQPVAVITSDYPNHLDFMRWGLVPSWAKDISIGSKLINARGETLMEKPSFRTAAKRRRCLIPADGFYEWDRGEKPSQPYYVQVNDGQPFAMAGLWEIWESSEGDLLKSCTIITTEANSVLSKIHDRMPVILPKEHWYDWLRGYDQDLLVPYDAGQMSMIPVSKRVNSPVLDEAALREKISLSDR